MLKRYFLPLSVLIVVIAIAATTMRNRNASVSPDPTPSKKESLNVLLISIDTLRADALGVYGNQNIKTPNIDSIGRDGALFRNTVSHVPLTLPSHACILTGNLPAKHGIHDNTRHDLNENQQTLASIFHDNGLQTAAYVSALVMDHHFGLNKGFDVYNDHTPYRPVEEGEPHPQEGERTAERTVNETLQWLSTNASSQFFLFVHFYDPHAKYAPPQPYAAQYKNPYWGEIAYVDEQVGRLLKVIEPIRNKTLIVLTSDHGEGFGEHEEQGHGLFLYDSTLRVPLMISGPGIPSGKEVLAQTRLIDIMPTTLDLTGIDVPAGIDGRSLIPLIKGNNWNESDAFSESYYPNAMGWCPLFSLRTSKWKFVQAPKPELYDLVNDPEERKNLYPDQKAISHQFSKRIQTLISDAASSQTEPGKENLELAERLKSLGYISGSALPSPAQFVSLPDPKDKVQIWKLYEESTMLMLDGKDRQAAHVLEKAIRIDSSIAILYDAISRATFRTDVHQSIIYLKKAAELQPENSQLHHKLGASYRKIQQLDKSVEEEQAALKLDPQSQDALVGLGTSLLQLGHPDQALIHFQKALQIDPLDPSATHQCGTAYRALGNLTQAAEFYRKSISLNPNLPDSYNALGITEAQSGNYQQAETNLKRALEVNPDFEVTYFNLGVTYQRAGRAKDAIRAFQNFIDRADYKIYSARIERAKQWIRELS